VERDAHGYRRDAWVEVDLSAIAENVRTLKSLTAPGTLFMAVVKADGYGHGAREVSRAALAAGADRLGVATLEEALQLREDGIAAPVHVLSEPPLSAAEAIVAKSIVPALASRDFAIALSKAAAAAKRQVAFHLKLDTGMNRIGIRAEKAAEFLESLRGLPGLRLEGVFTHFATADVPGDWDFDRQCERFSSALVAIRGAGFDPGIVHAANSAATVLHSGAHYSMVRCGIAIYGLQPAVSTRGRVSLRPAMSVKARVSSVKRIGLGEGVSYGLIYQAPGPTTIATLPLGYADGVHRAASNKFSVLIGGQECRQVGRVCMDQLMVEVPAGLDVKPGDEAVVIGTQGGQTVSMDSLAEAAGTINYEVASGLALRLPRYHR